MTTDTKNALPDADEIREELAQLLAPTPVAPAAPPPPPPPPASAKPPSPAPPPAPLPEPPRSQGGGSPPGTLSCAFTPEQIDAVRTAVAAHRKQLSALYEEHRRLADGFAAQVMVCTEVLGSLAPPPTP